MRAIAGKSNGKEISSFMASLLSLGRFGHADHAEVGVWDHIRPLAGIDEGHRVRGCSLRRAEVVQGFMPLEAAPDGLTKSLQRLDNNREAFR